MNPLVEILGNKGEIAFSGLGIVMVVLLIYGGFNLNPLAAIDFLIIAGFAISTASTLFSAYNYRQKRLAKMHGLERLEQTVCAVVQSNG